MLAGGASMLNLLLDWILSAVAIFLVAYVVPGFEISGFAAALLAALVVGLVNATLGLVLKILTFPLTIVTLGIFWIVINALMLMLAASFVPGFSIQGFLPAFIGAIVLSLVNLVLRKIKRELREEQE
jgi:putative membrane protein